MFGTLRPSLCQVSRNDRQAYRRLYCGTCKALGDGYGQLARPLLSYDVVFFAALVEATQTEQSETGQCRCPLLPVLQKPIVAPTSLPVRFAAAVQVVLASAWLDDQVIDGNPLYRPARALARSKATSAYEELTSLGVDMGVVRGLSAEQSKVEGQTRDIVRLASPTAKVLSKILSAIPDLPGAILKASKAPEAFAELGQALGLAIYSIDALEDLESDVERGHFNPCINSSGAVELNTVEAVSNALEQSITRLVDIVGRIDLVRGQGSIDAALQGLRKRARRAIGRASDRGAEWALLKPQNSARRFTKGLLTAIYFLPLWFYERSKRLVQRVSSKARPSEAKSCSHVHSFAIEPGSTGHGFGSGNAGIAEKMVGRKGRRRKNEDAGGTVCCCALDCCTDSCCCCCCDGGGDDGPGCCGCCDCCD